jgi:small GTP-binding protein
VLHNLYNLNSNIYKVLSLFFVGYIGGVVMIKALKKFFSRFFVDIFKNKKQLKLGLYGPPNAGKTTLANRICLDWLGEEMGSVSNVAHETREIQIKEQVTIKSKGKELKFNLVDTPGIATRIDYEDFIKAGIDEEEAKRRAKEATKGVIDSIKWLDEMDCVIIVLDATKDPFSQVNITIIGNLEARKIPVLIVGNKVDLKKADLKKLEAAFPQYKVIGISAKHGNNVEEFYDSLHDVATGGN